MRNATPSIDAGVAEFADALDSKSRRKNSIPRTHNDYSVTGVFLCLQNDAGTGAGGLRIPDR